MGPFEVRRGLRRFTLRFPVRITKGNEGRAPLMFVRMGWFYFGFGNGAFHAGAFWPWVLPVFGITDTDPGVE